MTLADFLVATGQKPKDFAAMNGFETAQVYKWAKRQITPSGENLERLLAATKGLCSLSELCRLPAAVSADSETAQ